MMPVFLPPKPSELAPAPAQQRPSADTLALTFRAPRA